MTHDTHTANAAGTLSTILITAVFVTAAVFGLTLGFAGTAEAGSISFTAQDSIEHVDGEVTGVDIHTDISLDWSIGHDIDRIDITLGADRAGWGAQTLDTHTIDDPDRVDSASVSLSGDLLANTLLSASDFTPDPGDSVSQDIDVTVTVTWYDTDGEVLMERSETDTATLTVERSENTEGEVDGTAWFEVDVE